MSSQLRQIQFRTYHHLIVWHHYKKLKKHTTVRPVFFNYILFSSRPSFSTRFFSTLHCDIYQTATDIALKMSDSHFCSFHPLNQNWCKNWANTTISTRTLLWWDLSDIAFQLVGIAIAISLRVGSYLIDIHFPLSLLLNKGITVSIQAWRLHVTINLNSHSCRCHFSTSPTSPLFYSHLWDNCKSSHGPMGHCPDGCHECCSHKQHAVQIHTSYHNCVILTEQH